MRSFTDHKNEQSTISHIVRFFLIEVIYNLDLAYKLTVNIHSLSTILFRGICRHDLCNYKKESGNFTLALHHVLERLLFQN